MTEYEKKQIKSAWKLVEKLAAEVNELQLYGQKLLQDKCADEKEVTVGQIYKMIDHANSLQTFALALDSSMSNMIENAIDHEQRITGVDMTFYPSGRVLKFSRREEEND